MPLPLFWSFTPDKTVSWHLPWCQSLQFLPICHWCPSSCCSGAESQRKWVCISPKSIAGPLKGISSESCSFFCCPNPPWFIQPEIIGTYLPVTGILDWVIWSWAGIPFSWGISVYHMRMWDHPSHISGLLHLSVPLRTSLWLCSITYLDQGGFFQSLVVRLPNSSISWWLWVVFVL